MKWWLLLLGSLAACDRPEMAHAQSETCGTCHQAQFASWSRSQHAVSETSPVFQALLTKVSAQWGTAARARCESCHSPQHADPKNIGCISCHAATGNRQEANGALIVDVAAPMSTTRHRPESPHGTQVRTFLSSSELCGT